MSIASCSKPSGDLSRGITKNGYNLSGLDWSEARTIAADPNIISLGTKVLIKFYDKEYQKYNGIYTVRDTGNAIHGYKIDFYLGDTVGEPFMNEFGIRKAQIYILK